MKQSNRGFNFYFIVVALLLMALFYLNWADRQTSSYTRAQFLSDIQAGNVVSVTIHPITADFRNIRPTPLPDLLLGGWKEGES